MQKLFILITCALLLVSCEKDGDMAQRNAGKGGSMARYTIAFQHLYIASHNSLTVVSLADPSKPQKIREIDLGFGIETIFRFGNYLLIGSQTGMHAYDVSDPANPVFASLYNHLRSCDPVVAQGNYAYVTLRSGSDCEGDINRLEVLDISNINAPQLVSEWEMQNPHGLAVDDTLLFICEGSQGLKVFDINSPVDIEEVTHLSSFHAYDVLTDGKRLLVIGDNGLFQYDYTNPHNLTYLGEIPY